MKRTLSFVIAFALILAMLPVTYRVAAASGTQVLTSGTDVSATVAAPVKYTWTASADGTLYVEMGATSPGWRFTITDGSGNTVGLPKSGKTNKVLEFDLVRGTQYTFSAVGWNSTEWEETSANITYTLSFTPADGGDVEIEMVEYAISDTVIGLGDNTITLLENAYTTIYQFAPAELGYYTVTVPEGAICGYWGAGTWFLSNPNSTSNTFEWLCSGIGQCAYIGVSGNNGTMNMNIEKTGDYEIVEIPIIPYENKADLAAFSLPAGSKLGSYFDVAAEDKIQIVLGEDGYYHVGDADGDVVLVDMNYMEIVLSNALNSDRPVMYAYVTDEDGKTVKYDIGEAIKAYEAVMDVNGYYPLTEDLILFYDTYANGAAIYTYHVQSQYNPDNIWLYCMRTVNFPEVEEPSEPEVTEPSEPEVTEPSEPEVTEPEVTEPEATEPVVTEPSEPEVTEPSEPEVTDPVITEPLETEPGTIFAGANTAVTEGTSVKFTWVAESNGTLKVTMGAAAPGWRYEITDNAMNTVGLPKTGSTKKTAEFTLSAGMTYTFTAVGWDSEMQNQAATNLTYALVFIPDESEPEAPKNVYEVSSTALTVGDNSLTLLETAVTTIYSFRPTEAGTYSITAPEGAIAGNWGASTAYLVNPNSTTNTFRWTCTSVGQRICIGISNVNANFVLTIEKVVEEPTEPTEPEVTEPSQPVETEPVVTEPSQPQETEPMIPVPDDTVFAVVVGDNVTTYKYASDFVNAISGITEAKVIVFKNIDLGTSKVTVSGNVVLDLYGNTITTKINSNAVFVVTGSLTVMDSSADKTGTIVNTSTSGSYGIQVNHENAEVILNSGNINATTQGIRVSMGSFICNGGNITAKNYGVYCSAGTNVTISGGYINSGFDSFNYTVYAATGAIVSITGGYFNGSAVSGNGLTGSVSGGYFARKFTNTSYLADDCYFEDNLDPVYLFVVINPNAVPEEPEVTEPLPLVDTWNLVLDDAFTLNFYLNAEASAQVQVTVSNVNSVINVSDLAQSDDGKYILPVSVVAAQMNDTITVMLVDDEATAKDYSVRQYADVILEKSEFSQYHAIVKEMLNYGAMSQVYFNYNAQNLANDGITDTTDQALPESADEIVVTGSANSFALYGASMVHLDKIAVRFYFTGDVSGCSFTVNSKSLAVNERNGMYFVDVEGILPQDLDQQITLTVTDADGNAYSVTYGPMNYMVRIISEDNANLKNLMTALYNYHLAAKALCK